MTHRKDDIRMSELEPTRQSVPKVEIKYNVDEAEQMSSFVNATLQGAGRWAVSIATYVDLEDSPDAYATGIRLRKILETAAAATEPGSLMFDVQIGPSLDYDLYVEDDDRPTYVSEEGEDDDG